MADVINRSHVNVLERSKLLRESDALMGMAYSEFLPIFKTAILARIDKSLNSSKTCSDIIVSFYTAEPNSTNWNRKYQKDYPMRCTENSQYKLNDECIFDPNDNQEYLNDIAEYDGKHKPLHFTNDYRALLNSIFIVNNLDKAVEIEF